MLYDHSTTINLLKGPRYLVVTENGVVGEFLDLVKAKQKISSINSGNKIIAEVNSKGELNTNPQKISNVLNDLNLQAVEEEQIYKLMTFSEQYLQSLKSRFHIIGYRF